MIKFTKVNNRNVGDIKLFALSTCAWCKKTKQFLDDNDIQYSYVDVDMVPDSEMDEALSEQLSYNPAGSFPTIVVNGEKAIVGYDEKQLKELVRG